jgi:XTP/dITP diphosphohydrolase
MTELLLASNNDHKRREFARLFPGVKILLPRDLGVEFDFAEDGETFFANAHGKAAALHRAAGRPVIGDDSGLCVDSLGGEPGIRSARYGSAPGSAPLDAPRRNRYLLDRMNGITERSAHFVCCLVIVLGGERWLAAQETVSGVISREPRGTNGFGYDPLFILPGGQTMAEISDAEKDRISHRGRAARRILAALRDGVDAGGDRQWT